MKVTNGKKSLVDFKPRHHLLLASELQNQLSSHQTSTLRSWRNLVEFRGLLWQFTARNIELRHRGSVLGMAWAVLNPLIFVGLYVFVFGFVFGGSFGVIPNESKWEFGLGVLVGLAIFHLIAEALANAPIVITTNPNFVKKVVFPLELLPTAAVGAGVFHMAITFALILAGVLLGGGTLYPEVLLLPIIVLPIILLSLGLTWILSALGVFFRDIGQIVGALTSGLLFASAIFYPATQIETGAPLAWSILRFNPLIHIIEMARDVVLWHRPVDLPLLGWLNLGMAVFAWLGLICFLQLKRTFADVI